MTSDDFTAPAVLSPEDDPGLHIRRRGMMLILSSPSGAGKSTIARRILAVDPQMTVSVSCTTRECRPGEVDGVDYNFITAERFEELVQQDAFLEHANVFGNRYGTLKEPVQEALRLGKDVLFDIDWQGTQQLSEHARGDLVTIFILPPAKAELQRRLMARAQDSDEIIARRMAKANDEISHYFDYHYVIINHNLERSIETALTIIRAERQKRRRLVGLADFVRRLQAEPDLPIVR